MSFSLIYDKQFIKVETPEGTKYAPYILAGDSNLWQTSFGSRGNQQRRSRSWQLWTWLTEGKTFVTQEEMLAKMEEQRDYYIQRSLDNGDSYSDANFGYHAGLSIGGKTTRNTTYGNYKGIVLTGCKKALTVEQLTESGYNVRVFVENVKSELVKTTEETLDSINRIQEALDILETDKTIIIEPFFQWDSAAKDLRSRFFKKEKKEKTERTYKEFFWIGLTGGDHGKTPDHFKRFTSIGYRYFSGSANEWSQGIYWDRKSAEQRLKVVQKRMTAWEDIQVSLQTTECNKTVYS